MGSWAGRHLVDVIADALISSLYSAPNFVPRSDFPIAGISAWMRKGVLEISRDLKVLKYSDAKHLII